ncbi:MAG: glycosyltransferase [Bdellovibrionota bacterium]
MRVLLMNPTLGAAYGQEGVLHRLGAGLSERGHKVFYVGEHILGDFDPLGGYALVPGLSQSSWTDRSSKTPLRALLNTLQCVGPEIVHLHDALEARLIAGIRRLYPTIFTAHTLSPTCPASTRHRRSGVCTRAAGYGCYFSDKKDPCLNGFRGALRKLHALESFRRRDKELKKIPAVIAVSHYVAETLLANGYAPERICTIENPVIVAEQEEAELQTPPLFVSACRLVKHKGIKLALKAFAELPHRNWSYWIVGDGPEKSNLVALAKRLGIDARVRFFSRLPQDRLHSILSRATGLIQANTGPEPFGLSVSEALALGTPVVVAKVPCFNSRLATTVGAHFFEAGRSSSLSALLLKALDGKLQRPLATVERGNFVEEVERLYRQVRADALSRTRERVGALSINGQGGLQVSRG